jgi:glycosyltransferase involved in cell wall biosynthesis
MGDLVSVVVPVYNVEGYVERCLKSIIGQTYTNLEIIVVDDGSKDSSGQICDHIAATDERMTVIHQENRGLSGARNRGLETATGEYICFIDSDDYISDVFVELQLKCMKKSGADVVQGNSGEWVDSSVQDYQTIADKFTLYSGEEMCHILMTSHSGYGVAQNKFYRRKLFKDIKFPEGKLHEDEFTVYRLFYAGNVALIDAQVYYYQARREGSICNSPFTIRNMDAVEGIRERMFFFKEKNNKRLFNDARLAYCNFILVWGGYVLGSALPEKYSIVKEMLREYRKYMWQIITSKDTKLRSKAGTVVRYIQFLATHKKLALRGKKSD